MTLNDIVANSGKRAASIIKQASSPFRSIWPRSREAVVGMIAVIIVIFATLTYITPLVEWSSTLVTGNRYLALAEGLLNPFRSSRLLMNSGLPVYDIDISHQELGLIEEAVEKAKAQGYMSEDLQVWATGTFFADDQQYNVKIRVRGDLPVHWEEPKKSWRIKFGKQSIEYNGDVTEEPIYFNGKRQINLIVPIDRDYILAPFINSLMREAGLVVPEDRFVVMRLNGVVQGLYYEVEHFDKPLLAAQERPETTVFGQNDRAMHFEQYTRYGTAIASDAKYDITTMRLQVEEEGEVAMQAMQAMQVLIDHSGNPTVDNFRRVRQVLDWEKYLHFRNMTTILNTNHVRFGSDNFKLYFDPSRGLLEPIPWDAHLVRMPPEPGTIDFWNSHGPDEIQRATLLDPEQRLKRNKMLWELVSDGGESLLNRYDELHNEIRPLAWSDVLSTPVHGYRMDGLRSDIRFNINRIYKVLSLSSGDLTYRLETKDRAAVDVVALNFSGILLKEIQLSDPDLFEGQYQLFEDINYNGELDPGDPLVEESTAANGSIRFRLDQYVLPELHYDEDTIDGRYWEYFDTLAGRTRFFLVGKLDTEDRHTLEWQSPDIQVTAENAVSGEQMPSTIISQSEPMPENHFGVLAYDDSDVFDLDSQYLSREEFLQAHSEFSPSEERPGAIELSGDVVIDGTIIIPESTLLVLKPGTDITMRPGASLLSYGGLLADGTAGQRIRIHDDGSGKAWGTFAVIRPPEEVLVRHIDIQGGGQAQINGILLTGGFAVHDGDLIIEHCMITDMAS